MTSTAHADPGRAQPIRLVIVISNLEFGGAQRQVVELANNLDPGRVEVVVCSLSSYVPLGDTLHQRRDRERIIEKKFKFDLSVVPRLALLLRAHRADIVHSYLFDADIAARLAGRLAGTRLIVGSERNTDYHLKRRQLLAYRATFGSVDLIIANSNAGAAFNRRALGHPEATYRVVHNGVDTSRFAPAEAAEAKRALGLDADVPVVGMFASFKEQKNHPLFFAAAARVVQAVPTVRFLLVGDELYAGMHGSRDYRQLMDRRIDELGLRERCVLLGNRSDVERLYPACDLTVLPSLFEGTPNVALESMACGVPPVVTDVADNRLIVPDGRAGFVVRLGDEVALADRITGLLQDHDLRGRLGRGARAWIDENYSSRRMAEKTEAVYREGLAARTGQQR